LLLLATGLVFGQTAGHAFVNFDDSDYVYANRPVFGGLSAEGIGWAFGRHYANWHPLTWLSLMVDGQFFGLHAGGYHLTNVLLHATTVVLLFLILQGATGRLWPSALAAALFAVHPLRVESVVWVTERKDVLSGLFFVLTLGAYVSYVRHRFSVLRYLAVMVFLALGLMAKSMLVTLPFLLLLLDYWPLGRMGVAAAEHAAVPDARRSSRFAILARLVFEKVPLFALVVISSVLTVWAQREALGSIEYFPLPWRIGSALICYVAYLGQFFYPVGLAVSYPRLGLDLPLWRVFAAVLVLVAITAAALLARRRRPYLLVGWLWYVGTLVPVIGLLQIGTAAMADRYTYLPQIGLCIALAWGAADVCRSWACPRWVCGAMSALLLAVLMGGAWRQTSFWRESEVLWVHTLACTSSNWLAHNNLARLVEGQGRVDEAIAHYRRAVEITPRYAPIHNDLAKALAHQGQFAEALVHYRKALELDPDYLEAHNNLAKALVSQGQLDAAMVHYRRVVELQPGDAEAQYNLAIVLAGRGRFDEAIARFQRVVEIAPDYAEGHNNLGAALQSRGRIDEALAQYRRALEIKPNYARVYYNIGTALAGRGRFGEAIAQFRRALEIQPDNADAQNNLAWLLATCPAASLRNGADAIQHAERANRLCGGRRVDVLNTLAAAYAEAGQFPRALATARQAVALATQQKHHAWADMLRSRIALYEAGKPFHQALPASTPAR